MNKVFLIGRLTKDPEIRYTQSGKAVATFTLAVDRRSSQAEKTADFIPIVAWEKLAETCGNHLTKGRQVLVEGRIQVRSYDTNEGQKKWLTEVIINDMQFIGNKPGASQNYNQGQNYDSGRTDSPENISVNSFGKDVFPEEEIPF